MMKMHLVDRLAVLQGAGIDRTLLKVHPLTEGSLVGNTTIRRFQKLEPGDGCTVMPKSSGN